MKFEINDNALIAVLSLFIGVAIGLMVSGLTNMDQPVNETLINQTFNEGYNIGVVETSVNFLQTGLIPTFNITEDGVSYLGDLNITEYLK